MGSFMDKGNQYIQLVKVLYCKLPTLLQGGLGFEPLTFEVNNSLQGLDKEEPILSPSSGKASTLINLFFVCFFFAFCCILASIV